MKKLMIFSVLFFSYAMVKAQANAAGQFEGGNGNAGKDITSKVVFASPYSLDYTTMNFSDNILGFENLPQQGNLSLFITDSKGNEMLSKKLSYKKNTTNISRLKNGIYFITLISESGGRRSFTLVKD
jgi:hypothetical protein